MTRRLVGSVVIAVGVLGIALCALGVVYTWRAAEEITLVADDSLLLISNSLTEIGRSLQVADATMDEATIAIDGLYSTSLDVGLTLSSTRVTVNEMAGLTQDDLPRSIESSLVALEALEETAGVIDQLLRGLQRFGIGNYDPEIALDEAVAAAAEGLEAVPKSLRIMGAGLEQTGAGLAEVQAGIVAMGNHVISLRQEATNADSALGDHRGTLEEIQTRIESARDRVERPIRAAAWGVTLVLTWIGLSQLAIVRWGVGVWQQRAQHEREEHHPDRVEEDYENSATPRIR